MHLSGRPAERPAGGQLRRPRFCAAACTQSPFDLRWRKACIVRPPDAAGGAPLRTMFCSATLTGMKSSEKSLVPTWRLVPSMRPGCAHKRRSPAWDWGERQGDPAGGDRDAGISARAAGRL